MARSRAPNRLLRRLLAAAGWTEDQLAGQVNMLAAECGLVLRLDRRSVTHWLAGRRPRPPVPEFVAEAFSRRLDRSITVADTGMVRGNQKQQQPGGGNSSAGAESEQEDPARARDMTAVLTHLAELNSSRHQLLPGGAFSLAALSVPAWADAITRPPARSVVPSASLRLQPAQVALAEQMAQVFSDADFAFGGGRSRTSLAAYLSLDVAPYLNALAGPALHTRMLKAAGPLVYLCGFMCFDDEQHGLAQRYYQVALELAAEAGDPDHYSVTLRAMSVQARTLGHHRQAFHLAETAAVGSRRLSPVRQAFLLGQVAVAAAADRDRRGAFSALGTAERRLNQATSRGREGTDDLVGGYHYAALAHQQAAVCALLGDKAAAITALNASIRDRPPGERRSHAILLARLAELYLGQGDLERAVATWREFLVHYPYLTSGRADTALRILRRRLRPYVSHPAVTPLLAVAQRLG